MTRENLLLASLPDREWRRHLKRVRLQPRQVLFNIGEMVKAVYFPVDAVVSFLATLSTGETIEAAMVGRDGAVGAAAALDGGASLTRAVVQLGGDAWTCQAALLRRAALDDEVLLALLLRHE